MEVDVNQMQRASAIDRASDAMASFDFKLLIDGKLTDGAHALDVIDPATERVFARCARADAEQCDAAVAAAKQAFAGWAALGSVGRRPYLDRFGDALETRAGEIAALLTREQGKPLAQSRREVEGALSCLRYYAGIDLSPTVLRDDGQRKIIEQRAPLGVLAAITPWNFPVSLLMYKIAPGLSGGNTMIAKPAPTTPLTTLLIGHIAADILPAGVLNTIVDANDLGARLTSHPQIAKIGFTGSTATGRRVMESAAPTLKRLTLELGGNDAAIVLDDVDVPKIAQRLFDAAMVNAGQVCFAAKRIYAPRKIYRDLCAELARIAGETVVGNGADDRVRIGPLQNRQQYDKVLGMIDQAATQGRVLAGGYALDRPGYFIAPTIICDIADDAPLVRDEQFGPVSPIMAYDDLEDVIRRANDSEYGLGGTIWTSDPDRGAAVAMRIETGTVWVNNHLDLPSDISFGGTKQSGIGREKGIEGLHEVTQARVVNIFKQPL